MDDGFILKVEYNGTSHELGTKFIRLGYIHQFHIHVDGRTLVIEFNEERECRIINASGDSSRPIDAVFLETIVKKVSCLY